MMKKVRNFITGNNRPGTPIQLKKLTIHETANTRRGADAAVHRDYAQNNTRSVSYHWVVDDIEAIQVIPDTEVAWHAGTDEGNQTSIGIEICENSDGDAKKRYINAVWMSAYLLHKHKLTTDDMVPHKYWSGKDCPRNLLDKWDTFKSDVSSQLEKLVEQKTHIMGTSKVTPAQMRQYLKQTNPDAPDHVDLYMEMEKMEGVRADVAFAQSLLETNFWRFGGSVSSDQNNFAGLGATSAENPGLSFSTPKEGIRAQGRHLRLYAVYNPSLNDKKVDPRGLPERLLGWVPFVEELSGHWATDPNYGAKIMKMVNEMKTLNAKASDKPKPPKSPNSPNEHWAMPEIRKLKERGIILNDHEPTEKVEFGVLATMLNRILDRMNSK